jgi:hypothetical protein
MSGSMLPVALYGLEVPAGEIMIPAASEFPATVSFTCLSLFLCGQALLQFTPGHAGANHQVWICH